MIEDIRRLLETRPFKPFSIELSSGQIYNVPTAGHAAINPLGDRVIVWFDDGPGVTLIGPHMVGVHEKEPRLG